MGAPALIGGVAAAIVLTVAVAEADVAYGLSVRTLDALGRGTVELEETITVSVKGERMREEVQGTRAVVTRRGARYQKPGHAVKLDLVDRGLRYEINVDAGTYVEESLADLRRQREEEIAAAARALGVRAGGPQPAGVISTDQLGGDLVGGRACEKVVLKATKAVVLLPSRGSRPAGSTPSLYVMTLESCLARDAQTLQEARGLDERLRDLLGLGGALLEQQLRIFDHRRDLFAVFELMSGLLEREQRKLGWPLRWQRTLVGPRHDQPEAVLFRQTGELVWIDPRPLDTARFELPAGLQLDRRTVTP
jgi:hypothetical protein